MNIRFSRLATRVLIVAAVALTAGRTWAVYHQLDPSKNEYGLKYDVQLSAAEHGMVNVAFTVADEGRLKPLYSVTVVAFGPLESDGGRAYDVKAPIVLKQTTDGKRAGQVQIPKKFADRAMIRILTLTVDGRRQTAGAAYYDIPLNKFLTKAAAAGSP